MNPEIPESMRDVESETAPGVCSGNWFKMNRILARALVLFHFLPFSAEKSTFDRHAVRIMST